MATNASQSTDSKVINARRTIEQVVRLSKASKLVVRKAYPLFSMGLYMVFNLGFLLLRVVFLAFG